MKTKLLLPVLILGFVILAVGCGKNTGTTIVPDAPSGLICIAGNTTVDISWEASGASNLAGYNIYRSTSSGSGYSKIATVKYGNYYWDSGADWVSAALSPFQANLNEDGPLGSPPFSYPNPCLTTAMTIEIQYYLLQDSSVTFEVYNINGEKIYQQTYLSGTTGGRGGVNEMVWDGKKSDGNPIRKGIYPYRMVGDGFRATTSEANVRADYIVAMDSSANLNNGTTYYYVITAFDTSGNESEYSSEVSVTPISSAKYTVWSTRIRAGTEYDPVFVRDI